MLAINWNTWHSCCISFCRIRSLTAPFTPFACNFAILHPPSPLHSERTEALASSQVRLCFAVQCVPCGARCPAAQRCAPYYTAPLRALLHGVSEVHEGLAPCHGNNEDVLPVLISFTSPCALMEFATFLMLLTLPHHRRRFPRRLQHAALPRYCACVSIDAPLPYPRTACYWHGYTDQLPPRPLLAG